MADFERLEADWLSYDEARARILSMASPLSTETLPPGEALGRSLSAPVHAKATLPAWRNSAMDGFSVRSEDLDGGDRTELRLPVAERRAYPGSVPMTGVPKGSAVRIMTGGPVPDGFDSVIRVEHTDGGAVPGFVVIRRTDDRGKHVRRPGQDTRFGEEMVPAGTVVHSGSLPVILASGCASVPVFRRPRVGVLSSGDELVGPGDFELVTEGKAIPDTNKSMIAAAVSEMGGDPVDLGVAADDPADLEKRLRAAEGLDLLVTTGGASMGERDLVKRVLMKLSFRLSFWRVRIRPGSPLSLGHLSLGNREIPVFSLPGNPASAFVTFHVFVAPYLRARLGSSRPTGTRIVARTDTKLTSPGSLTHFYRVRLNPPGKPDEGVRCSLTGPQGSGLVRSLRDADGLAIVPEGTRHIGPGEPVSVILLPGAK